jgi:adenylylsulfate kinase
VREYRKRSIVKAICWRAIATLTTVLVVFIFTRQLTLAVEVGAVEVVAKLLFYYLHERTWTLVIWGKPQHPLAGLTVTRELEPEHLEEIRTRLHDLGYL